MAQSTKLKPIRNGQTINYYYTFLNSGTGAVIPITGRAITWKMKVKGVTMTQGSGTVENGAGGIAFGQVEISVPSIMSYFLSARIALVLEVNVQFFADGIAIPGQPMVEYVVPNVADLAASSERFIEH